MNKKAWIGIALIISALIKIFVFSRIITGGVIGVSSDGLLNVLSVFALILGMFLVLKGRKEEIEI